MKMYFNILFFFIIVYCPLDGIVLAESDNGSKISQWMQKHNISIRKTFDGSKNESKPAAIQWVNNANSNEEDHYLVDIAVKLMEWDLLKNSQSIFTVYPVAEWHRNTKESKPVNNASGSLKLEFYPLPLRGYSHDGKPIPPTYNEQRLFTISPFLLGSVEFERDFYENQNELKASLSASLASNKRWLPGSDFRKRNGAFIGRYYPYLGYEYYEPISSEQKKHASFGVARLYIEYWPVSGIENQYLQMTLDWIYRYSLHSESIESDKIDLLTASISFYLDGRGNIAIGYEYLRGEDPKSGFSFREQSTIGLRIKF